MIDDNNPEEKPSFFDSADEAKSWPPSEGYEVEESDITDPVFDAPKTDPDALDEILAKEEPTPAKEVDHTDKLMQDFSSSNNEEDDTDQNSEEEFLVPVNKEDDEELSESSEAKDELAEEEAEEEFDTEEETKLSSPAQDTDRVKIIDDDDDDTLSNIFNGNNEVQFSPEEEEESIILERSSAHKVNQDNNNDDFNLDKYVQEKTGGSSSSKQDTEFTTVIPPITNSENGNGIIQEEYEEDSKPFRTYSSLDYGGETLAAEEKETSLNEFLSGANRNLLILALIILAALAYFLFTNVFNRKYDSSGRRRARRPAKEKRINIEEKELVPLWEVSSQKTRSAEADRQLVQTIYRSSGRDNPFAMPDSILADLQKAANLELIKKQKPNTYRRLAYRATLVGVLTSNNNTIALINQQEATFDVLEGTAKDKILKLATKSMDRAKKDTQEMVVGSYIGPWLVTKIESPESVFSEAKVHIEFEEEKKILNMGKAEELGIFTEEGQFDNLDDLSRNLEDDIDDFDF